MYGNRPQKLAPVKVGDELDVKIEAIGEKGDGIARKEGFVLIIPGANKDDEVKVRVTRVLRKVGFAEVIGKGKSANAEESEEELPAEEASEEEEEIQEEEEPPEDSEDFGEELDE